MNSEKDMADALGEVVQDQMIDALSYAVNEELKGFTGISAYQYTEPWSAGYVEPPEPTPEEKMKALLLAKVEPESIEFDMLYGQTVLNPGGRGSGKTLMAIDKAMQDGQSTMIARIDRDGNMTVEEVDPTLDP